MAELLKHDEMWRLKADGDINAWRVAESPRYMPCYYLKVTPGKTGGVWVECMTKIRVKIKEPGVYCRVCPKCEGASWYILRPLLDPSPGDLDVLTFRWITEDNARQILADDREDLYEGLDLSTTNSGELLPGAEPKDTQCEGDENDSDNHNKGNEAVS